MNKMMKTVLMLITMIMFTGGFAGCNTNKASSIKPTAIPVVTVGVTHAPVITTEPTVEPVPTAEPSVDDSDSNPTLSPEITEAIEPTNEPLPTSTLAPTATASPTATPIPVPTSKPTNTPVPVATSVPVADGQYTVSQIKDAIKKYGSFIGGPGMAYTDYEDAMNQEWALIETDVEYKEMFVDVAKAYTYENLISIWKNMSALDGVSLYEIGRTVEDRPIYMICIDRTTAKNPKTVVLTGNTHARETAGSVYITKQLNDFLNDKSADEYLKNVRIYAVPCVNPDGREGIAYDTKNWTYSDGLLWKSNANGVDLNRNFPGLSWGQIKNGNSRVYNWSDTHTKMYFPGYSAGSEPETRALMKFLQYTVVDLQADVLIDYHQQGRLQYAGKPWQTSAQQNRCIDLANMLSEFIADGKAYCYTPENSAYGLSGEGSTLTDYACSLAVGAKFSEKYGFLVYSDGENEYPLIMGKKVGEEANPNFATATLEIGSGTAYLGYSEKTRKNLASEYDKYNFGGLLYQIFDYVTEDIEDMIEEKEFKILNQEKYPTGCESVSAVMVLNYLGYDITVDEFIDNHLDMISSQEVFYKDEENANKYVFDYYFVGNPRSESGSACSASVIVKALNSYLDSTIEADHLPVNLTGAKFDDVVKLVNKGKPVLLWVSGNLTGPTRTYELAGRTVRLNRHCCVLLNADKDSRTVTVADPMTGTFREWSYDKVEEQFNLYGQQAVCLTENY